MKNKADTLLERAVEICRQQTEGASQTHIQNALDLTPEACLELVNALLKKDLVDAHTRGGELLFKEKDAEMAGKLRNLTAEDMLVFQSIKASGRQGIWSRDIRRQTNLAQTAVGKVLKNLETRLLVKSVKSVNDGKRKIYVLYDVEPANELTGGLWFQGNEMDLEFIGVLQQQCQKYVTEKKIATVQQIQEHIQKLKILNVPLDEESINAIVQTLHYDGVFERVAGPDGEAWQMAGFQIPDETSFTAFPCGTCPVIEDCTPGGQISPEKCIYFDKYFQF